MSQNPEHQKNFNLTEPRDFSEGNFLPKLMTGQGKLQEFGQKVSVIRELEMTGKLSRFESSEQIKRLWNTLKQEQDNWGEGDDNFLG